MKVYGHVIASSTVLTASSWTAAIDAFFEDVAVAPMHRRFDPLIDGTGMKDHQIIVGDSVNLGDRVDERDSGCGPG